jgi:LacI family transcriptional regulator
MVTVTIKDVARAAGVSPATVSRVFNETAPVDDETRARVLSAAEALRYVPNAAARSLITSRTATVGVLLPDLHGALRGELLRGLGDAARRRGFDLLISSAHGDPDGAISALRAMRGRVDGVILMLPSGEADTVLRELPAAQPVVLLGSSSVGPDIAVVAVDEAGGAEAMVRHLVRHGHRRIALLAGADGDGAMEARVLGYRQALAHAGIHSDAALEIFGATTEEGGHASARRMLALTPPPTALFAASDAMAAGALAALREAGIAVPDEMAVAGFGDTPIARFLSPALSSVRVPANDLGRLAIDRMLLAVARGGRTGSRDVLECVVVPRASCGVHEQA